MSSSSGDTNSTPPGLGVFKPTNDQLAGILRQRIEEDGHSTVPVIADPCTYKPSKLRQLIESLTERRPLHADEYFFFTPNVPKAKRTVEGTGQYWKINGKKSVTSKIVNQKIMTVSYVSFIPSPSSSQESPWVIHEYELTRSYLDSINITESSFIVCRLINKQGE